jgi:hypothetical protein
MKISGQRKSRRHMSSSSTTASKKYLNSIIADASENVKQKTYYEVIKGFNIDELVFCLVNFRQTGIRSADRAKELLESEVFVNDD